MSSTVTEPPALRRLRQLDTRTSARAVPTMGYQPGLDGLRAVSVIAVILYHAGFGWMHGGFLGVEVFFVVSGFLITSLLLEEHAANGRIHFGRFWARRARRLLPALFAMLAAVAAWCALFGSAAQRAELRRDLPWAIFYAGNWGQILGQVPYFSPDDPPLLRHLWSLAVEEQWYVMWPLLFAGLMALRVTRARRAVVLLGASAAVMLLTVRLARFPESSFADHPVSFFHDVDRVNFMYLSTFTRASGLLLGAAMAFVWRPWGAARVVNPRERSRRQLLDGAGLLAIEVLVGAFLVAHVTDRSVYRWLLPAVSIASVVAVMSIVHPSARAMRAVFGWRPLVEIGKRSYGLYLWHWPIFVVVGARHGGVARFVLGAVLAVGVSELCYRYVEMPVRRGALGRWVQSFRAGRAEPGAGRDRTALALATGAVVVVVLVAVYARARPVDRAVGGDDVAFEASAPTTMSGSGPGATAPAVSTALPRRVAIVGDSTAHSLAVNLPSGIESTFRIADGSLDGCSVYDDGKVLTSRTGFSWSFTGCKGWSAKWARAVSQADAKLALVVIGAWDVFDVQLDTGVLRFGTAAWDQRFLTSVGEGIGALRSAGATVAVLEVPCMRPVQATGAAVPPLPERADDRRVAHVNQLLRRAVEAAGVGARFVAGPAAWCKDPGIATDTGYRWDGVHVYKPGAKLIFDTIAPALLGLP